MPAKELSPREKQIVNLTVQGMTNEAIAHHLGLSVGTVNTYWIRIKLKVGGQARTDTVVKVIQDRAETALRAANVDRERLASIVAQREHDFLDLRAALALLHLAMDQIKSTVWATDMDLVIQVMANGEFPSTRFGIRWEVGKSVYDIFKTKDPKDLAIAAHLGALNGAHDELRLAGQFSNMLLRVAPLNDEAGETIGCLSILNLVEVK